MPKTSYSTVVVSKNFAVYRRCVGECKRGVFEYSCFGHSNDQISLQKYSKEGSLFVFIAEAVTLIVMIAGRAVGRYVTRPARQERLSLENNVYRR
jgi:hypothetical protein